MVSGTIYNAYKNYFNIIEAVGQYSSKDVSKILLLSYIDAMEKDGFTATLSEQDKQLINNIQSCIQDSLCIIPYTNNCLKKPSYDVTVGDYESCVTSSKKEKINFPYAPNIEGEVALADASYIGSLLIDLSQYIEVDTPDYDLYFSTNFSSEENWMKVENTLNFTGGYESRATVSRETLLLQYTIDAYNSRDIALLDVNETLSDRIYYKVQKENGVFDVGLIEITINGVSRDRNPNYRFLSHGSCVLDGEGYQTGYSVDNYVDTNVYSSTYQQTVQRTTQNETLCVPTAPVWVLLNQYCQNGGSGYHTGILVSIYRDENPNSGSYGQTKTTTVEDFVSCPLNAPNWVKESSACELENSSNTGYRVDTYRDTNQYSDTYNQTREEKVLDLETCPIVSTDPLWQEISRSCNTTTYIHTANPSTQYRTGYATVTYRDVNPASATYNTERTETVTDTTTCPVQNIGYIEFEDSTTSKSATYNYEQRAITIPLKVYVNDVLQGNVGNASVLSATFGGSTFSAGINVTGLSFTLPENTSGVQKTGTIVVEEVTSGNTVTFNITQTGDAVFLWTENSQTALVKSQISANGATLIIGVTSLGGNTPLPYTITSIDQNLNGSISGNTLTIVVPVNGAYAVRNMGVTLTQTNTNNTITLTVQQEAAASVRVFAWANGQASKTVNNISDQGSSDSYGIISTYNGQQVAFSVAANTTNASTSIDSVNSALDVDVPTNTSINAKSGTITVTQAGSGLTITLTLEQLGNQTPVQNVTFQRTLNYWSTPMTVYSYTDDSTTEEYTSVSFDQDQEYLNIDVPMNGYIMVDSAPTSCLVTSANVDGVNNVRYAVQAGDTLFSIH